MRKRSARQGLTHLADAAFVPCRPGESKARNPGTSHTGVGCVCILNVRRAVHRGPSLREGVLAKASAVRPRAMPQTQKRVHTNNTDTEQTTRTHCAVYATTRNRTPSLVDSSLESHLIMDCRAQAVWRVENSGGLKLPERTFMSAAGYHRERQCGGAPSWYDGGWTQEGKARNKSLAGCEEWGSGQGSDAARASTEGGKEGMAKETGDAAVTKIKAAEKISVIKCSVLKEHIREAQRILDGKKGSLRKTYKNQAEATDKVWSLNENTVKALVLLAPYYERFETANKGIV